MSGGVMLSAVEDRLGSVGKYYPYGEERNSPQFPNDQVKFATYTRDSGTGLDYADQRYYASTFGRFMTPDPYKASGGPGDPGSWNQYAYTRSDPINRYDPYGLDDSPPFGITFSPYPPLSGLPGPWGDASGADLNLGAFGESAAGQLLLVTHFSSGFSSGNLTDIAPKDRNLTLRQRTADLIWMRLGQGLLQNWTATGENCLKDLGAFGLTSQDINQQAGSTTLVDYRGLSPAMRNALRPGADFTAVPGANSIIYNIANFWQFTFAEMEATLVHEYIHMLRPDLSDIQIQSMLALEQDDSDHSNISIKLANDCFGGAAVSTYHAPTP
jgi:RHS repeat-associated protein